VSEEQGLEAAWRKLRNRITKKPHDTNEAWKETAAEVVRAYIVNSRPSKSGEPE